jgi:hypothetical protein
MAHTSIKSGEAFGLPIMKFNLTYEGPLPSSGNKRKPDAVWRIREKFHPQLVDLWKSHPALRTVAENSHFPKTGGASLTQAHHLYPGPVYAVARQQAIGTPRPEVLDLCEEINKHGRLFRPLVRETYALHCGLKILFLRKEAPGHVYQGGDLDGRMKTLLDALSVPQHKEQVAAYSGGPEMTYCLLEDDALISGVSIESERLLGATANEPDYAKLTIEVDVRVKQATIYNQSFLG